MSTLPIDQVPGAVLEVVQGLQQGGFRAFLVGGCVRDLLRGSKPKDFDVASSARPEEVQKLFKKVIPTGIEHGTVTVLAQGNHVEVTTFRAEAEYLDGRRPSKVEFHEDIEADLSRRDFTMNAIAWDPVADALVDPWGGQVDLAARTVRCVRSAFERFSEDGLRPLRAVRFATVLDFTIDPETEAAIGRTLEVFKKVAGERVNQEFVKILGSPHVTRGLELLARTGLLGVFLPEAATKNFAAIGAAVNDEVVRLSLLLEGVTNARDVLNRLKYPSKVCDEVGALVKETALPPPASSDADLRRWLARVSIDRAQRLLQIHHATTAFADRVNALIATNPPLTSKTLALDGKAIMNALGTGPSPVVGQATRHLLELVLEDPSLNTPAGLTTALNAWKP